MERDNERGMERGMERGKERDQVIRDVRLQEAVMERLVGVDCLDAREVQVDVREGIARLLGWVESASQAEEIARLAIQVPGVASVRSELRAEPRPRHRADEDLGRAVLHSIAQDADIDTRLLKVRARQGDILITGWVGTREQFRNAEANAWWTAGVLNVINHLQVGSEAPPGDPELARALVNALIHSPRLAPRGLSLRVSQGVATLRGWVATVRQREAALEIVRTRPGIRQVADHLRVCKAPRASGRPEARSRSARGRQAPWSPR